MSSYEYNDFASFFIAFVKIHKPKLVVETGILNGYSLIAMAKGLPEGSRIIGIDLFDDYEFNHGNFDEVSSAIWDEGLSQIVDLIKSDALLVADKFEDNSIDIFHIDISNDGMILANMFKAWQNKIKKGGLLVFEGGSEERDNVDWMKKYNKVPIKYFKDYLRTFGWEYVTLSPYPSLTICRKP